MSEKSIEIKNELKESNLERNNNYQIKNISNTNINNEGINNSIFVSQIQPDNPILIQLINLGYDPIYSGRIIQFLHPRDVEEALDYFSTNNNIIQHRFIQDKNKSNILCYICGEKKEKHLGYIHEINNENNVNINDNIEINNIEIRDIEIEDIENTSSEIKEIENNNNEVNNNEINNNEIDVEFNNNKIDNNNKIHSNDININYYNINTNAENNNIKLPESNNTSFLGNNNIENSKQILSMKYLCLICSDYFTQTNKNTLKNCGHSFCDDCWYYFLSTKIKENKLTFIKCLNYECQEKLSDEFIIQLLKEEKELISRYKNYKFELDIINDPNKKLCPFPNCDSFLKLKNKKKTIATCANNHSYCFICLGKPHLKMPCKEQIDKSLLEFSKNNFLKKCPNCNIITEKISGCNHITCSKCNYQWCRLCNQKFNPEHYTEGKCKGFQFYMPKNENDIQLAFEGKVTLTASQRQNDVNYPDGMIHMDNFDIMSDRPANMERRRYQLRNILYSKHSFKKTLFILFIYIIFGHIYVSIYFANKLRSPVVSNKIMPILLLSGYFLYEISNFFFIIYTNIIMLIPYLINLGFFRFIDLCWSGGSAFEYAFKQISLKTIIFTIYFFIGGFFNILFLGKALNRYPKTIQKISQVLISIIYTIIYFPIQFIINQIIMILIIIFNDWELIKIIDKLIRETTGFFSNIDYD